MLVHFKQRVDSGGCRRRSCLSRWAFWLLVSSAIALDPQSSFVRYRARVAYNGTGFRGFQLQSNGHRTVQGVLEEALHRRFGRKYEFKSQEGRVIKVVASGRTDTGVHARGQAIHFDAPGVVPPLDSASLNALLSPDVRVWNVQVVPVKQNGYSWNALYESTRKLYSYRLSLAPVMDPLERPHRWHPPYGQQHPIDPSRLAQVLKLYEGTHDFRTHAGMLEQTARKAQRSLSTIRTVYAVNLVPESNHEKEHNGNYRIDFSLKGALYRQVRNMVGTALDVCRGRLTEAELCELLELGTTKTRADNKSKPAPPEGLTLEMVYFDNDPGF